MANPSTDLHVLLFPFLAPGHIIPLVHMAKILTGLGVKATIVTTPGNAPLIQSSIDDNTTLLTIPFPSTSCPEDAAALPTPEISQEFLEATLHLEGPFERLINERNINPDCIISDSLCPWATDVASRLGIPRIVFHGSGNFACTVMGVLKHVRPHEGVASDDQPFLIPGLLHPVQMRRSQLARDYLMPRTSPTDYWTDFLSKLMDAVPRSFGNVMNSFYEMEPDYAEMFKNFLAPKKVWTVGPLSLWNQQESSLSEDVLSWLEKKKPGSVLYVCFGSLGQFTSAQFREMAVGLEACDCPFIWVVRNGGDESEWMPKGFEDRVVKGGKGLIIRGWVSQVSVLHHRAVGGFVTHCGTNSIVEGASAGLPMVTWPLFQDHFFNERLLVDVLNIGVPAGSQISSYSKEERTAVSGEQLQKAVNELMSGSEEADERRRRAKKLAEMARGAVKDGGSSYNNMMDMIQELVNAKKARTKCG